MSNNEGEKAYKKILCIDGGGIKGVFAVAMLSEIEKKIEGKIYEYFDLISGTSTGGIIALGLALGLTANELLTFYKSHGPDIFKGYKDDKTNWFNKLIKYSPAVKSTLYNKENLEKPLRLVFDGQRIGDCKTRVLIPSVNVNAGVIHIFKTSHHQSLMTDYKESIVNVALATSAAPIYLGAHEGNDHNVYIDGGIGANDPSGIAAVEGITKCGWNKEDIKLLSIGCLGTALKLDSEKAKTSGAQYLRPDIMSDLFMNIESQYSAGIAKVLLGEDKYLRIDCIDAERRFDMDGATKKHIESLIGIGIEKARYNVEKIINSYFTAKAEVFVPIHK